MAIPNYVFRSMRYLLGCNQLLCLIFGITLLLTGLKICDPFDELYHFLLPFQSVRDILWKIGAVITAIAFIGFWGTATKNAIKLFMFAVGISIFSAFLVASLAVLYSLQGGINDILYHNIFSRMFLYRKNRWATFTMDSLQSRLSCCGSSGPVNWIEYQETFLHVGYPASCCSSMDVETDPSGSRYCSKPYELGCSVALEQQIDENFPLICHIFVMILLFELMMVTCACILGCHIRREKKDLKEKRCDSTNNISEGYQPVQTK